MMRPRPRPPLWFEILFFALAAALLLWVARHLPAPPHTGALEDTPVALGFFAAFIAVVEAIWTGIQAVGQATLAALAYTVHFLWAAMSRMGSWALELGRDTIKGFRAAWSFVRALYDDVLKPAWQKFWKFVDWARHTLDHLFAPVIKFLRAVRKWLLAYYDKYVRPVLDTIEVSRKVLQLLAHLGVGWAKTLDEKLAAFQNWVYDQFYKVWSKVNEAIDAIDYIRTAGGLFQRLIFAKTLVRDARLVGNAWMNALHRPLTSTERARYLEPLKSKSIDVHAAELRAYLEGDDGPDAAYIDELAHDLEIQLRRVA